MISVPPLNLPNSSIIIIGVMVTMVLFFSVSCRNGNDSREVKENMTHTQEQAKLLLDCSLKHVLSLEIWPEQQREKDARLAKVLNAYITVGMVNDVWRYLELLSDEDAKFSVYINLYSYILNHRKAYPLEVVLQKCLALSKSDLCRSFRLLIAIPPSENVSTRSVLSQMDMNVRDSSIAQLVYKIDKTVGENVTLLDMQTIKDLLRVVAKRAEKLSPGCDLEKAIMSLVLLKASMYEECNNLLLAIDDRLFQQRTRADVAAYFVAVGKLDEANSQIEQIGDPWQTINAHLLMAIACRKVGDSDNARWELQQVSDRLPMLAELSLGMYSEIVNLSLASLE